MEYQTTDKKYLFRINKYGKIFKIEMSNKFGFNCHLCGYYDSEDKAVNFVNMCIDSKHFNHLWEYISGEVVK